MTGRGGRGGRSTTAGGGGSGVGEEDEEGAGGGWPVPACAPAPAAPATPAAAVDNEDSCVASAFSLSSTVRVVCSDDSRDSERWRVGAYNAISLISFPDPFLTLNQHILQREMEPLEPTIILFGYLKPVMPKA